jgi:hypothetical protein
MAQNTFSVQRGNLTIKFSRYYRIDESQQHKLVRSLEMAWTCLSEAIKRLESIRSHTNASAVPQSTKDILSFHFFQNNGYPRAINAHWVMDVAQIKRNFTKILVGLRSPVAIADSYGTTVGRAWEEKRKSFEENLLSMVDMGLGAPTFDDYRQEIRKTVRAAEEAAKEVRGFVAPKSSTRDRLSEAQLGDFKSGKLAPRDALKYRTDTPKMAVQLSSEDFGSIHLNFLRVLRTDNLPPSELSIAQTIIHEASHKFVGTHDFAYAGENGYSKLDRREAMLNADSYALAAPSLARDCLFKDGNHLTFEEFWARQ